MMAFMALMQQSPQRLVGCLPSCAEARDLGFLYRPNIKTDGIRHMSFGMGASPSQVQQTSRPPFWRLLALQCLACLLALLPIAVFWPEYAISVAAAGCVCLTAQAFWIWRSLRSFGDPGSGRYLTGAIVGLIGKWVIILVGLIALLRNQPELSVAAMVTTVFALNTLAALAAPISISQPHD